jgi:nitroreductase
MTVEDAIKARQSIRRYLDRPVEPEVIDALIESASLAPSASNRQEWRYVAVSDPALKKELSKAASNQGFVSEAGCVFACCAETDLHEMRCGQLCYPIDLAISIDHITLRAVELGLGTCWIGSFSEEQVKKLLDIPDHIRVVELLTVGYPADATVRPKNRLAKDKILFHNRWGETV